MMCSTDLPVTCFTQHDTFQVHPCCCIWQHFILLLWLRNIPLCVFAGVLHLPYPFVCWWTLRLLLVFSFLRWNSHDIEVPILKCTVKKKIKYTIQWHLVYACGCTTTTSSPRMFSSLQKKTLYPLRGHSLSPRLPAPGSCQPAVCVYGGTCSVYFT